MAKNMPPATLDLMLDQAAGDNVHVCSAEPTTYTEANSTYKLATQAISSVNYAKAAGDVSGRKNTLTPPTGTSIANSGTATHVAVTNGTTLKLVTTCTSQALTAGGSVDIGAFAHEVRAPS